MKLTDLAVNIDSFCQPIVAREDTYLSLADEQDAMMSYVHLMYQGTHFTGTVFEQGAEYAQLIEYQKGLFHGKHSFFNGKGAMTQEIIYDNNSEIGGKTWHEENGALGSVWGHNYYASWYADGLLFYEKRHDPKTQSSEETFYFRNGKVKIKGFTQNINLSGTIEAKSCYSLERVMRNMKICILFFIFAKNNSKTSEITILAHFVLFLSGNKIISNQTSS